MECGLFWRYIVVVCNIKCQKVLGCLLAIYKKKSLLCVGVQLLVGWMCGSARKREQEGATLRNLFFVGNELMCLRSPEVIQLNINKGKNA